MKKQQTLAQDELDRGMIAIEDLYKSMLDQGQGPDGHGWGIHPEVKSRLHKRILHEIKSLRESQRNTEFGSVQYREIDCRIRRRVLKEIQIIIDAYVIARQEHRVKEWESMYGDIEHYRREFFYFRMDSDYEHQEKMLVDYKIIEE
jgi:hypothetical protein